MLFSRFSGKCLILGALLLSILSILSMQAHALTIGDAAPDFTLKNQQGTNLNLAEQRGEIILINFWASWCGPCRKEMPVLQKLQDKYQDLGVQVWGVNVEQENQAGKDFLADLDLSFSIFFDQTNSLSKTYQVEAMPTTVMIDRNGKVRFVFQGYQDGYEKKYAAAIKQLIRE
ncbi:TlpA family protein disulfide reductase [Shewanella saliphila]|uniref:Thiol:disulfide interchange protein n=1 Tax=Shewanella saliphila TaxID=2282698 RepID=A0ABQ2QAT4_9GAMM|nr:TlpA disulfide reductase family protein [Shewanella saliphila]MCL1099734.1 TlpA family protein disulfide reductase [Shewanella saliphila]GGP62940.1 thiol:disulfide interchange protein [Shewanella saliphila]